MKVTTESGVVEGFVKDRVVVFKGIPYAAPPVGDLRWARPQKAPHWSGVRRCDTFGKSCIQPTFDLGDVETIPGKDQSEDCLYLNVWTTGGGTSARKPVMVWIHGGAFKVGNGNASAYDGMHLALKGAVVVSFNYRLGHLGFFAHPALERHADDGPVNFGLLDQIRALTWVKDNILEFGGDPGNVTIFGQSAGGVSVLALFASTLSANLFHRGIAQSAYALPEVSRERAIEIGAHVGKHVFRLPKDATVADLRRVKPEMFALSHYTPLLGVPEPQPIPSLAPTPAFGDEVLRIRTREKFADGQQLALPLLLGSTSNEESILTAFGIDPVTVLEKLEQIAPGITDRLRGYYQGDTDEIQIPDDLNNPQRFGGLVMRDFLFTMQARWISQMHWRNGARRYYFRYVPETFRDRWPHGVPHGGELVFPFNTGGTAYGTETFTENDKAMAAKVSNYWFTFAQTGTPAGEVAWPAHTASLINPQDKTLRLERVIGVEDNFRKTRLETYAGMYPSFVKSIDDTPF